MKMIDAEDLRDCLDELIGRIDDASCNGILEESGDTMYYIVEDMKTEDERLVGLAERLYEARCHLSDAHDVTQEVMSTLSDLYDMDDKDLEDPETEFY